MTTLDQLQQRVADLLREYTTTTNTGEREHLGKLIAANYVTARERFLNSDGEPDWHGRTYGYREWVREVFALANIPAGDKNRVSAAVRYHVPTALRERLGREKIAELGLDSRLPSERRAKTRQEQTAFLKVFTRSEPLTKVEDAEQALGQMDLAVRRIFWSIEAGDMRLSRTAAEALTRAIDGLDEETAALRLRVQAAL